MEPKPTGHRAAPRAGRRTSKQPLGIRASGHCSRQDPGLSQGITPVPSLRLWLSAETWPWEGECAQQSQGPRAALPRKVTPQGAHWRPRDASRSRGLPAAQPVEHPCLGLSKAHAGGQSRGPGTGDVSVATEAWQGARGATPRPSARVPRLTGMGAAPGWLANCCNNEGTFRDKVACSLSTPGAAKEMTSPLGRFCTHLLLSRKRGYVFLNVPPRWEPPAPMATPKGIRDPAPVHS